MSTRQDSHYDKTGLTHTIMTRQYLKQAVTKQDSHFYQTRLTLWQYRTHTHYVYYADRTHTHYVWNEERTHPDNILHDGITKHPVQLDLFVFQHVLQITKTS